MSQKLSQWKHAEFNNKTDPVNEMKQKQYISSPYFKNKCKSTEMCRNIVSFQIKRKTQCDTVLTWFV